MRNLIRVPQFLALSACLLVATSLLHAQAGTAAPSAPAAGRAGPMQLTSATPLAETENLDVYPAAPEGFNVARENISHGEVKVVEYRLQNARAATDAPGLHGMQARRTQTASSM